MVIVQHGYHYSEKSTDFRHCAPPFIFHRTSVSFAALDFNQDRTTKLTGGNEAPVCVRNAQAGSGIAVRWSALFDFSFSIQTLCAAHPIDE